MKNKLKTSLICCVAYLQLIPILLIIATTSIHRMLCDSTEELLSNNNVTDAFDVTEPATTMQPEEIDSDENLDAPATTETLPDLILAENVRIRSNNNNAEQFFDDKNTAKRTISSRFTGPIIVNDEENLFTPADEIIGRQINVQILEPDPHNNGQFLKQTVYTKTENNTVFSTKTTTTTTTERPTNRRKNIVATRIASSRYVPPLAGPTVSNCPGAVSGCSSTTDRATVVTEGTARKVQNVDINQSVQVKRVIIEEPSKQYLPFGTRFTSTTKSPCQLASAPSPCSSTARTYSPTPTTPRVYSPTTSRVYSSTPTTVRVRPLNSTPLIPRVYTTPTPIVSTATVTSVPIHSTTTTIVPEPIIIHRVTEVPTVRIVEKPVTVEKVVKEFVNVPGPTVEKIVPYEVEKVVVKEVKVPVNTVIEKHINHPPQFVEKFVPYPVHNVVQAKPIEIPRIIHKEVHVPVPVDRIVEKPVPYQVRFVANHSFPGRFFKPSHYFLIAGGSCGRKIHRSSSSSGENSREACSRSVCSGETRAYSNSGNRKRVFFLKIHEISKYSTVLVINISQDCRKYSLNHLNSP